MNRVCNMCGKPFDMWDDQENFGFDYYVGYGSKHDLGISELISAVRALTISWISSFRFSRSPWKSKNTSFRPIAI